MFDDNGLSAATSNLPVEDRQQLIALLQERADLAVYHARLNKMKVEYLIDPTPEREREIDRFSTHEVDPAQRQLLQNTRKLARKAIDLDGLKSMGPALLAGVLNYVNVPFLLHVVGLNPSQLEQALELVKEYLDSARD